MTADSDIGDLEPQRKFDLEERTFDFACSVRDFIPLIERRVTNIEYAKQLIRSSGSVAANYIEANESLSKKDFIYRLRVCKKEAKESRLWLRLLLLPEDDDTASIERDAILQEALELTKIFGSIIRKNDVPID